MSQSFLVVAADPVIESLVGELVSFAGYRPWYLSDDETVAGAIRNRPPFGLLLDASHHEPGLTSAARAAQACGVIVVYFASAMSSAELRAFADARGAHWFALPNGPNLVGRVLAHAVECASLANDLSAATPLGERPPPGAGPARRVMTAALLVQQQAQLLVASAQLLREENAVLRDERSALLSEARACRSSLREAVERYASALRVSGVPAQEASSLVRTLLIENVSPGSGRQTAERIEHDALEWVAQVYAA
jgi:hypothetical protein